MSLLEHPSSVLSALDEIEDTVDGMDAPCCRACRTAQYYLRDHDLDDVLVGQ